jgi:hypothetical protein
MASKKDVIVILSIIAISFGLVSTPFQVTSGLDRSVNFRFLDIPLPLGSDLLIKITGSAGEYQQWREHLYPFLNDVLTKQINLKFGFKNGEYVTACVTTLTSASNVRSCDGRQLNLQDGTDFFLSLSGAPLRKFN